MIDWQIDRSINWPVDRLIDCLISIDWLTDKFKQVFDLLKYGVVAWLMSYVIIIVIENNL